MIINIVLITLMDAAKILIQKMKKGFIYREVIIYI